MAEVISNSIIQSNSLLVILGFFKWVVHLYTSKWLCMCPGRGRSLMVGCIEDRGRGVVMVASFSCSEKVHEVPNLLVKYRESKHYLQATELLVNSGR